MELADRIEALWLLLRMESPEGVRARRRVAATTAMAIFIALMLAVVGLGSAVAILASIVVSFVLVVAAALVARRHASRVIDRARALAASARHALARLFGASARAGASARGRWETHAPAIRSCYASAQAAAGQGLATASTQARSKATAIVASTKEAWPTRTPVTRQHEGVQANAAGVQLRRDGAYAEAAEQHRFALEIFRELGDRRSEALTLNNLALALDRVGDPAALDLFEEAAAILRDLGEEEHEGKVIANLGMAFRRRGADEQSAQVFELALGKLDPESEAYRQVERLRRAS